jgi:hypothetical protein
MKMIKWASDIIENNIKEAEKYAHKAHELRDVNRAAADWCKEMATSHLRFNDTGHGVVKKLIEAYVASGEHSPLEAGMRAVYNERHADLMHRTAEVQALLNMYK